VLFPAQVPSGVLSGGEDLVICSIFLVTFNREQSVESVAVRPYRKVCMLLFLF
jgi:hypothetical protein